jgi:hypothetical protein
MNTNITTKLAGIVGLLSGGSLGIGSVIAKPLTPDGADVASVFVTNGGCNGVQQVLRLSTPLSPKQRRIKTATDASSERSDPLM